MFTMIDEIFDRGYQAARPDLHNGVDALIRTVREVLAPALSTLHHIEWDAPWRATARPTH